MKTPTSPAVKQIIKDISSNYVKADMASRTHHRDAKATELKHLLYAIHDCYVLVGLYHDGGWGIEKELALSYAKSGSNTAKKIEGLVKETEQ